MTYANSTAITTVSELDRYMAQIRKYPVLSAQDELDLAKKWHDEQDIAAAQALVTSNLRFVVKIANEYRGYGARMMDLIQEGSVGLMHAVKRFDPYKGYRLISYAVFWIRSYIHTFLMGTARMVKIGTSRAHRKLFFKLRSYKAKLSAGTDLSEDEVLDVVAREFNLSRDDVVDINNHLTQSDSSVDVPARESGTPVVEIMPAEQCTQEDMLEKLEYESDINARLTEALETLDERERRIVESRYLRDQPVQMKVIGEQLGITKQRVAQLEKRALKKLKDLVEAA